eukprot:s821_g20.t1
MRGRLRTAWAQGSGWKRVVRRSRWGGASLDARTAADGVGAREWVETGGEKEPLGMSELGCADGCGRRGRWKGASLDARTAADGVGGREWVEMGGEKEPLGMSELGGADGCGRRGCKGVGGNGWGEGAAEDERAWMRGRLRTAWVQGSGWKWVVRRSRWG